MSESGTASPPENPASSRANQWYFDFLRRELELVGQAESAKHLRHFLRVGPAQESTEGTGPTVLRMSVAQRVTEYTTRVNADSGEILSWYVEFLAKDSDTSADPEELQRLAAEIAQPPPEAVLACSEYEGKPPLVLYRARWKHVHAGLPVEGDYIEVLMNGRSRKAFSFSRAWRTPDLSGTAR